MPQGSEHDFFLPDLYRFIAVAGSDAYQWAQEYRSTGACELEQATSRALILLRQGKLDDGHSILNQVAAGIRARRSANVGVRCILERWYSSVLAYLHYRHGDYGPAVQALEQAEDAVGAAIESEPFLVPFAHHCVDFRFQRARISRNQRHWHEMRHHLENVLGMMEDRLPLCVLTNGNQIGLSTVRAFYDALPLTPADRLALSSLLDDGVRLPLFRRAIVRFYATLGGVIQYP